MLYMARTSLPINLFSDSQLHKIGYTQYCDVPLRGVRTLDLDFEAIKSHQRNLLFSAFLPAMVFDYTPMNYVYRGYSKNHYIHNLLAL